MDDKVLSICISSYCKSDRCIKLVNDLLAIHDERFDIYVCDDGSDGKTVQGLCSLSDDMVKVILHKKNVGACKNWYRTIDCGTGKYILHVLDRDDIAINSITMLLDILQDNEIGAGYIGKSSITNLENVEAYHKSKYYIYREGREAVLTMGGIPIHPTGFFVNRNVWKEQNYKKYFYNNEKYGIYPHAYVLARIAVNYPLMNVPINFCRYQYTGTSKKSQFYGKAENKNYWWLPDVVIQNAILLIAYILQYLDDTYRDEYIVQRFKNCLYRSTIGYKITVSNKKEMDHYGESVRDVSCIQMILISVKNLLVMRQFVEKTNYISYSLQVKLFKCWTDNLQIIFRNC